MKYAVIINEIKFGAITQLDKKLYSSEAEAQEMAEKSATELIDTLNKFYKDKKYTYTKKKKTIGKSEFYINSIWENDKIFACLEIIEFEE